MSIQRTSPAQTPAQRTPAPGAPAHSMQELVQMANVIAEGGLFGKVNVAQVCTLLLIAQAENIHPMKAVLAYDIIQGKPAMKSKEMLARFQHDGGMIEWLERGPTKVTGRFTHPRGGSITVTWTIEQARQVGLAGKDNWKNYPAAMLTWRCASEGVRAIAPGVLNGMYTTEEVRDFGPGDAAAPVPPIEIAELPAATPEPQPAQVQHAQPEEEQERPEFEEVHDEPVAPKEYPAAADLQPPIIDKPAGKYPYLGDSDYASLLFGYRRAMGSAYDWGRAKSALDGNMLKRVNKRIDNRELNIPKGDAHPRHLPDADAADFIATYMDTAQHKSWGDTLPFSLDDALRYVKGEWDAAVGDLGEAVQGEALTTG